MADNIDITPGTGTTVATDDAGANGHVQLIKLAIATNGVATLVPADATNGLLVDVSRVQGSVTVAEPVTRRRDRSRPSMHRSDAGHAALDGRRRSATSTLRRRRRAARGTNNIGDVDVLTLPALATGTNTIGGAIPKPRPRAGCRCSRRSISTRPRRPSRARRASFTAGTSTTTARPRSTSSSTTRPRARSRSARRRPT